MRAVAFVAVIFAVLGTLASCNRPYVDNRPARSGVGKLQSVWLEKAICAQPYDKNPHVLRIEGRRVVVRRPRTPSRYENIWTDTWRCGNGFSERMSPTRRDRNASRWRSSAVTAIRRRRHQRTSDCGS
jgi:hypothetical protein